MARYIDADALLNALKEERKNGNFVFTSKWIKEIIDNLPPADVVPKSEVIEIENKLRLLEDKLTQYEQVCGKLIIKDGIGIGLLPDGKETVYILKSIAKVTKELAIRRTRQEVAMEIFEELQSCLIQRHWNGLDIVSFEFDAVKYAELKKSFTESEDKE